MNPCLQTQEKDQLDPAGPVEPLGHAMHCVSPAVILYFPGTQLMQGLLSCPPKPAAQTHAVAPAGATLPGAHNVQRAEPGLDLKVFMGHATHGPPAGPVVPGLQAQEVIPLLPGGELEFSGHGVQAASVAAVQSRQ